MKSASENPVIAIGISNSILMRETASIIWNDKEVKRIEIKKKKVSTCTS